VAVGTQGDAGTRWALTLPTSSRSITPGDAVRAHRCVWMRLAATNSSRAQQGTSSRCGCVQQCEVHQVVCLVPMDTQRHALQQVTTSWLDYMAASRGMVTWWPPGDLAAASTTCMVGTYGGFQAAPAGTCLLLLQPCCPCQDHAATHCRVIGSNAAHSPTVTGKGWDAKTRVPPAAGNTPSPNNPAPQAAAEREAVALPATTLIGSAAKEGNGSGSWVWWMEAVERPASNGTHATYAAADQGCQQPHGKPVEHVAEHNSYSTSPM
jgi:hypothetical protein